MRKALFLSCALFFLLMVACAQKPAKTESTTPLTEVAAGDYETGVEIEIIQSRPVLNRQEKDSNPLGDGLVNVLVQIDTLGYEKVMVFKDYLLYNKERIYYRRNEVLLKRDVKPITD